MKPLYQLTDAEYQERCRESREGFARARAGYNCDGSKKLAIAKSKKEFDQALFSGLTTFDAYIVRVKKNGIVLWYMGETYTLNPHHVFCLHSKLPNGKTWYSYGGKLNEKSMRERENIEDQVRALVA